jgi:hypothetical protein
MAICREILAAMPSDEFPTVSDVYHREAEQLAAFPENDLMAMMQGLPPSTLYPAELQRRLLSATVELREAIQEFDSTSRKTATAMIWLTGIIVVLTIVLVILTVVLLGRGD